MFKPLLLAVLLLAACGEDSTLNLAATSLEATPGCYTAEVPPPRLARLELADDGSAVSVDSEGRRVVFATWERTERGIEVRSLKIIGWWAGTVELVDSPEGFEASIAWGHGYSTCRVETRLTPTDDRR